MFGWCFYSAPDMYVDVVLHSERGSTAEIYYADTNEVLAPDRSSRHAYPEGESRLLLPINQKSISTLRFAPSKSDNTVTVTRLRVIDRVGVILDKIDPTRVRAGNQMEQASVKNGTLVLTPTTGATDPYVFVNIGNGLVAKDHTGSPWVELTLVLLLGLFLLRLSPPPVDRPALGVYAPLLLGVACIVLVAAFLMTTSRSVNPDETMHIGAARYYLDNWLPPAVGDLRVASDPEAYGPWGFSYLDEWDICYFFAGKLAVVLSPLIADESIRFRLLNVLMLFVLIRVCLTRKFALPLVSLLLISPQVWYVFSYFNGDAFALAAACLAVFYLTDRSSFLFDDTPAPSFAWHDWRRSGRKYLLAAALISLVLLSKRNFWSVLPFIALIWASRIGVVNWLGVLVGAIALLSFSALSFESQFAFARTYSGTFFALFCASSILFCAMLAWRIHLRPDVFKTVLRVTAKAAIVVVLTLFISAPRIVWDRAINGNAAQKNEKLLETENHYAIYDLKPSTIRQGRGLVTNRLEDRGYSLGDLFAPALNWQGKTVATFFGAYGYTQYATPSFIVTSLFALATALFLLSLWQAKLMEGWNEVLVMVTMMAVVVGNSILASWIIGFQAQGRYLFPLLPFAFLHLNGQRLPIATNSAKVLMAFSTALGIYSFLYYGLTNLVQ